MADKQFDNTVDSLFKGMDSFLTTKTVVGDAVRFDDGTIILPLVDVSFGMGARASSKDGKNDNKAAGGMGGKMSPNSVLIIKDGMTRLVNIKNQDTVTKVIDMVPDLINRFSKGVTQPEETKEVKDYVEQMKEDEKHKEK